MTATTVPVRIEDVRPGDVVVKGDLRATVASEPRQFSPNLIAFSIDAPHPGEWLERPGTVLDVIRPDAEADAVKAREAGEIFAMGDQPTTCPYCGRRTMFDTLEDGAELHRCTCGRVFVVEVDEELSAHDEHEDDAPVEGCDWCEARG